MLKVSAYVDTLIVSNDTIKVYVPSYALRPDGIGQNKEYAGTGVFKIVHRSNDITIEESSEQNITVTYAVINKYYQFAGGGGQTQPVMLTTGDNNGEYIVAFTPVFDTLRDVNGNYFKDAFEKALDTWCATTSLNYIIDENAYQTGNYDLLVDYGMTQSPSALAATLIPDYFEANCPIIINNESPNHPETHEVDFIDNITITFNQNQSIIVWDASSLMPTTGLYSVQQVSLHELGHAHGIRHTNHDDELMYYAANSSFSITNEAKDASNYLQNHSGTQTCSNGIYQKRTDCTTGIVEVSENLEINSRYANGEIIINSSDLSIIVKINIYSVDGKLIKSVANNQQYEKRIPFHNVDGIYIVSFFSEYGIYSDKLFISK